MSQGKVTVNNLNLGQGNFPEVERTALFIGIATKNQGTIRSINTQSNLDDEFGEFESTTGLKAQVAAAKLNGGENWQCYAAPISFTNDWRDALENAMQTISPELVAVCVPATAASGLRAAQATAEEMRTQFGRRMIIVMATYGIEVGAYSDSDYGNINGSQTWSDYEAAQAAITSGVSAYRVSAVPLLHGNDLGALVGRLCNRSVSIADSPMRVVTGPVLGLGATPVDDDDVPLPSATLTVLDANRLSVMQRYVDYPGQFWGDCNLLDEPAGDYQVIENLRVIDKAARAVRILAIRRVANRLLNESPASIATNKTYFMRPLREMSRSVAFGGEVFPGDIVSPSDDSITIVWPSRTHVEIYLKVRPYNSPKEITANIVLDLKTQ
jgi:hypothetical protein